MRIDSFCHTNGRERERESKYIIFIHTCTRCAAYNSGSCCCCRQNRHSQMISSFLTNELNKSYHSEFALNEYLIHTENKKFTKRKMVYYSLNNRIQLYIVNFIYPLVSISGIQQAWIWCCNIADVCVLMFVCVICELR